MVATACTMCTPWAHKTGDMVSSQVGWAVMQAFKGMRSLITNSIFTATDAKGSNLLWAGLNYKGAPLISPLPRNGT